MPGFGRRWNDKDKARGSNIDKIRARVEKEGRKQDEERKQKNIPLGERGKKGWNK